MATYNLTISYDDGISKILKFDIPETQGTYRLQFTLDDGSVFSGNVVVGLSPNTYRINGTLTNGNALTPALFSTPVYPISAPSLTVQYNRTENTLETQIYNGNSETVNYRVNYYTLSSSGQYVENDMIRDGTIAAKSYKIVDAFYSVTAGIIHKVKVTLRDLNGYQKIEREVLYSAFIDEEEETTTTD